MIVSDRVKGDVTNGTALREKPGQRGMALT